MRVKALVLAAVACVALATPAWGDWDPGQPHKWLQLPDLTTTGIDVNATANMAAGTSYILADDFLCTETGLITDIHIWGSWRNDLYPYTEDPGAVTFTLSIHADIPAEQSPTEYSMPGEVLWTHTFGPGEFVVRSWTPPDLVEWWWSPMEPPVFPGDHNCWQYNFDLENAAFTQQGTLTNPVVYWLDVQAVPQDPDSLLAFGWKTSQDHWNDAAVWGVGEEPYPGPWNQLLYPFPPQGERIDLAFVIASKLKMDWGDAPDPTYPTLAASDGANHGIVPGVSLGLSVDADADGQPDPAAEGDDLNGVDDEDGVTFLTPIVPGTQAHVQVQASAAGFVSAWIDMNGDGNWTTAGDRVLWGAWMPAGTTVFACDIPQTATPGIQTFARFRYTTLAPGTLGFTGAAADGEVEDYMVSIEQGPTDTKWIQYPDLRQTGIDVDASRNLVLADDFECTETGRLTEFRVWGSWLQDYLPGGDPGAVQFNLSIRADIPAEQSPTGYSMPGELLWERSFLPWLFVAEPWLEGIEEGWFDPMQGGYQFPADWTCWLYTFQIPSVEAFLQVGTPEAPVVYWFSVNAVPNEPGASFGWKTSVGHWNDDAVWGTAGDPIWHELRYPPGHPFEPESIDLAFAVSTQEIQQDLDYGDAPDPAYPTLLASDGARHVVTPGVYLGNQIDWEADGQPTPPADGDDLSGLDDEDGVFFFAPLQQGGVSQVTAAASIAGFLDAWVDFNRDGDWADANERIFTNLAIDPTSGPLSFNVPLNAKPGPTYARFRFSTQGVASYTGLAPDGEVEDYLVQIEGQEWKWIQAPDVDETGIDVCASQPFILADDYLCDEPGRITEIYVWGSWLSDYLPFGSRPWDVEFTLSIHADIPADESGTGYSMPGEVLWSRLFPAAMFSYGVWQDGILEGWMNAPDAYVFPGDWTCWLYSFSIPPAEAFQQVGTPDEPVVYWLDVQARSLDSSARFGWKTTVDHWNDDAVWGLGAEPYNGPWSELRYPEPHPWYPNSIDLAFAVLSAYGTDVPEDIAPEPYGLFQNAPNPFNPMTTISYQVPDGGGNVTVEVYDVNGRHVRTLVDEYQSQGGQSVEWDGKDDSGAPMATGVYFYRMAGPGFDASRKMLLLK